MMFAILKVRRFQSPPYHHRHLPVHRWGSARAAPSTTRVRPLPLASVLLVVALSACGPHDDPGLAPGEEAQFVFSAIDDADTEFEYKDAAGNSLSDGATVFTSDDDFSTEAEATITSVAGGLGGMNNAINAPNP